MNPGDPGEEDYFLKLEIVRDRFSLIYNFLSFQRKNLISQINFLSLVQETNIYINPGIETLISDTNDGIV